MIFIPYIFFIFAFFILLCYAIIIIYSLYGFHRNETTLNSPNEKMPYIEVIVAFKNEEHRLPHLLATLNQQNYKNFRVLFIDDFSTDNSTKLIQSHSIHERFIIIKNNGKGKKAAIRTGIQVSKAPFLVFTDADCALPNTWLSTYSQLLKKYNKGLFFGWVTYQWENILQRIFALEFLSLTGVGMGLAKAKAPIYMNGANYAISRNLLDKIKIRNGENYVSGDDVFLLHAIKKQLGSKYIIACANTQIAVTTKAPHNIPSFIKQRIRWGSKAKAYNDFSSQCVASAVFMLSLMQIAALIFPKWWLYTALLWILKSVIDLVALWQYQHHAPAQNLITVYPLFLFFYPFYLIYTAFYGLFSNKKKWLS